MYFAIHLLDQTYKQIRSLDHQQGIIQRISAVCLRYWRAHTSKSSMNVEKRETKQRFPKIKNVIFDWKRTLYDPESRTLINGAVEILEMFSNRNIPIFLIGKGEEDMYKEVDRLDVGKFFNEIKFVEGEKNPEYYKPHIDTLNPSYTVIIGDRARSELSAGKSLMTTTVWVRQGVYMDELPEDEQLSPDYQVGSLAELKNLLQS